LTALLYLAAGAGRRFGGNKLEAELNGMMLGLHAAQTLSPLDFGWRFAVGNPASTRLNSALGALGFSLLINPDTSQGLSRSLAIGAAAVAETEADALLICLGDMPRVSTAHIESLRAAFDAAVGDAIGGRQIVASSVNGQNMPPALFGRAEFAMLTRISGDKGARALLSQAQSVAGDSRQLVDVDTIEALKDVSTMPTWIADPLTD
jgi:molybdenum cofactor cytidylyltransferase